MNPKMGKPISFIPTPQMRDLLEQLVATGLWGRKPGSCVERIVGRFFWEALGPGKPACQVVAGRPLKLKKR